MVCFGWGRLMEQTINTDPVTVLLVDDDENTRVIYGHILEHAGFRVVSAEGGHEALAIIASAPPRVILLDIQLPDISGLEVFRRLAGTPAQAIPVVAITASATAGEQAVIRAHGFRRVLIKPIPPRTVVDVVQSITNGQRRE